MLVYIFWGFVEGIRFEMVFLIFRLVLNCLFKKNIIINIDDFWRFFFIIWDVNIKKKCK